MPFSASFCHKENTAYAESLAKTEADVALIQAKVILSIRTKKSAEPLPALYLFNSEYAFYF